MELKLTNTRVPINARLILVNLCISIQCSPKQSCRYVGIFRPCVDMTTHFNKCGLSYACKRALSCMYVLFTSFSHSGKDGMYAYTKDLLELEYTSRRQQSSGVDPHLAEVWTPLHLDSWLRRLRYHPDRDFSFYILRGIEYGFYIGVNPSVSLTPAASNMQSAIQHPEIIDDYLQNDLLLNRILVHSHHI